jgi:hypothetical protein
MTKFVHIVQIHPVENGEPNLYKVKLESEWDSKSEADTYVASFNAPGGTGCYKAVYYGCVNDETGELV